MVEKLDRLRTRVAQSATLALYGAKNGLSEGIMSDDMEKIRRTSG